MPVKDNVEIERAFHELVGEFQERIDGTVGIMVRVLESGLVLATNADTTFPTASTLKVPLLYALYALADAADVDLTERVTLDPRERVPGSGVLQNLDGGLRPTVRDLAELMIIISDNYATDLLYRLVGRERLAQTLADLDLSATYLPHPTWHLLAHMIGVDPDDPELTYETFRTQLQGSTATSQDAYPDDEYDRSTPADMVTLMTRIEEGYGLSSTSRDAIIAMLKHQTINDRIPARLPEGVGIEVAHKTGSVRGVRNDVGIVYSPNVSYAIAIMTKDLADPTEGVLQIAHLSRRIWDMLSDD